jgi:heat shock protein HslJ
MMKHTVLALAVFLALTLSACSPATAPASTSAGITGIVWEWTSMEEKVPASQSVVPDPKNYTIIFAADGTVNIKADCNNVSGTYKIDGSNLNIVLGPSTLAACSPTSLDQIYLASLQKVSNYSLDKSVLSLGFAADAGQMHFSNGGKAK